MRKEKKTFLLLPFLETLSVHPFHSHIFLPRLVFIVAIYLSSSKNFLGNGYDGILGIYI